MSFGGFGKNSGPTVPPSGQTPFGHFPRPSSPPQPQPPAPFLDSSAPPQSSNPRTFGTYERPRSLLPFDNACQATAPSNPSVAPSRAAPVQWGDRQNSSTGDFRAPIQKRSFPSGPHDIGTNISSKASHVQDFERTRSPVQYTDDFLAPIQKRSLPSGPHDIGTNISPKASHFQDLERTRSPVQYNEDFLADPSNEGMDGLHGSVASQTRQSPSSGVASNHMILNPPSAWTKSQRPALFSHQRGALATPGSLNNTSLVNERRISPTKTAGPRQSTELFSKDDIRRNLHASQDASRRPSVSPPKSRNEAGVLGMPDIQHNQRSVPSTDGMNGDTNVRKFGSHSAPKRNRSPPPAAAGQISQTSSYYTEDDTERELQAKARRLARFKTELDEVEPSDSMKSGSNVAKRLSSLRTDQSAKEKQKFTGDSTSGTMEDMSQDVDNEDLQSCSVIVGLCPDMCPESERVQRERKGDLDRYERLDGDRNRTTKTLAVKKYTRTAEREAELIRPMPILKKTMDYLLALLDQSYDDRFLGLYNFLWDRMRAIRMDLRMQHIFNIGAISMLEQMIRLHIIAMHELCEFSKGEGFSEGFDAHLNIEQMNKASVELFQLYDDHRKRGVNIPTEKEFRGYYALLKLDKHPGYKVEPAELSLDLAKMTAEIRQTHEVLFARDVARSCRTGNFIAFFRHARKASYLQACLIHAHFSKLRTQALASLHSGLQYNQGVPVTHIANWLGMEGEDIENLLEYHGFLIKEFEEPYMVKEGPFLNAEKDYPTQRSNLVDRKKSSTIVEDILSSHQMVVPPSESKKELQSDKKNKHKYTAVQPSRTKSPVIASDGVMDVDAFSSPRKGMQVQPLPDKSTSGRPYIENNNRASVSFTEGNIDMPKAFASSQSPSMQEQPSPVKPKDVSLMVDDGKLNLETSPPWNFSTPLFIPVNQPTYFDWARETSYGGLARSSPEDSSEIVVQCKLKALKPDIASANVRKTIPSASEVDPGTASLLQDDVFVEEGKEFTDVQQKVEKDESASYYDEEVAEAKLKLLLRLWRRRSARKREFREQNRLAANAALNSLSLGPPIHHSKDKPTPCRKLDIDQAVGKRYEKRHQSWARWNVSELVAGKLGEKNANSKCTCWKVISFSWLHWGNGDSKANNVTHLSLEQWLRYKLIPARNDETVEDLVMSAPGMAIWRKWVYSHSGSATCCLSVIKDVELGNFDKKLVGASAMLFPLSHTVPLELQKVQLHNLVMSLPAGACIPLLVLSGSSEYDVADLSCNIADKLGLEDIDKSRVGGFLVKIVNEREDTGQFDGYFSDQKLKEGLMWLASETRPQPVLRRVTMRDLVTSHLSLCLDAHDLTGSDTVEPNQYISVFNEALDLSMNEIVAATSMNPTGWPCPEVYLLDNSTAEFTAVRQFLPSLGWSSPEEVEPLISTLRNFRLPSFSDNMTWLSRGCSTEKDIEDQRQLLQDCLIRYLTQSSNVMNRAMATKEANVMLQKCTRLELHNTEYKVVPSWLLILRRVFNWQLNNLASIISRAYVLEQSHSASSSPFLQTSDFEVSISHYITQPSLDEMVEVSCSPVVSRRVSSSPKSFQNVSEMTNIRYTDVGTTSNYLAEEEIQCSVIQVQPLPLDVYEERKDLQLVPKSDKEADRLSMLLNQCNILQDNIERKLSIYF